MPVRVESRLSRKSDRLWSHQFPVGCCALVKTPWAFVEAILSEAETGRFIRQWI